MSIATSAAAAVSGEPLALSKPHPSHPLTLAGQQVTAQVDIRGVPTTLLLTSFVDRIFLVVTQLNKMGSLTLATTHQAPVGASSEAPSYSVTTLLGVRQAPLPQLLARRLIESLSQSRHEHMARKPLLLSIALQKRAGSKVAGDDPTTISDEELATIKEIVAEVDKIKPW